MAHNHCLAWGGVLTLICLILTGMGDQTSHSPTLGFKVSLTKSWEDGRFRMQKRAALLFSLLLYRTPIDCLLSSPFFTLLFMLNVFLGGFGGFGITTGRHRGGHS